MSTRRRATHGIPGQNTLLRDGEAVLLGGKAETTVLPGDEIEIATPGGGGWGVAEDGGGRHA